MKSALAAFKELFSCLYSVAAGGAVVEHIAGGLAQGVSNRAAACHTIDSPFPNKFAALAVSPSAVVDVFIKL